MPRMRADQRRHQLLEIAAECFAEHGYRGTTTAMIAAKAGVSEPIIYRHFKNKQDLFIALIEKAGDEVFQNWQKSTRKVDSPLEKLRVLMYQNPATSDPHTARIYRLLFHASTETSEPAIQDAIRAHYQRYVQSLAGAVEQAQATGLIRDDVPAVWLTWQIIHAAVGFAMIRPLQIPGHASMEFAQGTIRLLLELLTHRSPKR